MTRALIVVPRVDVRVVAWTATAPQSVPECPGKPSKDQDMSDTRAEFATINRRSFARYLAVLGAGIAVGAAANGNLRISPSALAQSTETVDPTATREAELAELHALQTQVANPVVCSTATPAQPTPTATQVPPSGAGIPLSYAGIWTITVLGIVPIPGTPRSDDI